MTSKMLEEALASCDAVAAQLQRLEPTLAEIAGRLRRQPPQVAMTIARGSSDHAATREKTTTKTLGTQTNQHLFQPVQVLEELRRFCAPQDQDIPLLAPGRPRARCPV